MILFIENPKEPIKLPLELKNKFSKVAGEKTQKYFYIFATDYPKMTYKFIYNSIEIFKNLSKKIVYLKKHKNYEVLTRTYVC